MKLKIKGRITADIPTNRVYNYWQTPVSLVTEYAKQQ
jgi:hypothetical protein